MIKHINTSVARRINIHIRWDKPTPRIASVHSCQRSPRFSELHRFQKHRREAAALCPWGKEPFPCAAAGTWLCPCRAALSPCGTGAVTYPFISQSRGQKKTYSKTLYNNAQLIIMEAGILFLMHIKWKSTPPYK